MASPQPQGPTGSSMPNPSLFPPTAILFPPPSDSFNIPWDPGVHQGVYRIPLEIHIHIDNSHRQPDLSICGVSIPGTLRMLKPIDDELYSCLRKNPQKCILDTSHRHSVKGGGQGRHPWASDTLWTQQEGISGHVCWIQIRSLQRSGDPSWIEFKDTETVD